MKDKYGQEIEVGDTLFFKGTEVIVCRVQRKQVLIKPRTIPDSYRKVRGFEPRFWWIKKNELVKMTPEAMMLVKLEETNDR